MTTEQDFETIEITDWTELLGQQRPHTIYRGQANEGWKLSTSLQRACEMNDAGLQSAHLREQRLLSSFKRHFHGYTQNIPNDEDELRWLALMQHHGAPTRLMDWSYSILVAAYFALESTDTDCAIWEIDTEWLRENARKRYESYKLTYVSSAIHHGKSTHAEFNKHFRDTFLPDNFSFVRLLSPYFRDERITTQQSAFVCPGKVSVPFMTNLVEMRDDLSGLRKIVIPLRLRKEFLYYLFTANIGRFSLFPGLDGFSASLRIFHPVVWDITSDDGTMISADSDSVPNQQYGQNKRLDTHT